MATARMWIQLLVVTLCSLSVTYADTSGARITLTSKALNYVSSLIVPLLEKELSELNIADIRDKTHKVKYSIKNIRITKFSIQSSPVSSSAAGITLQLSGIRLEIKCKWKYKKWGIRDHGKAEIDIKRAAIKLTVLVSKSSNEHPVLKVTNCEPTIPSLSVSLHGGASWFYKIFKKKIEKSLKKGLLSLLCKKAHEVESKWNAKISSYPLKTVINQFTITYGLFSDPKFTSTHIQLDLEGGISPSVSDEVSIPSIQLPEVSSTDKMVYFLLTPKLFGSFITATIQSGVLYQKVTHDTLSTPLFKKPVPLLFKAFPNMDIALEVTINRHDEIYIDPAGIHATLLGDLLFQVIQSDKSVVDAFSVKMIVQSTLQVDVVHTTDKPTVMLEADSLNVKLGQLSSSIGDFDTTPLETFLNGMSHFFVPIINGYVKDGFAIPKVDKVTFTYPSVTMLQNCVQIGMDFVYT